MCAYASNAIPVKVSGRDELRNVKGCLPVPVADIILLQACQTRSSYETFFITLFLLSKKAGASFPANAPLVLVHAISHLSLCTE